METTLTGECAGEYVRIYIANTYELYLMFEWLIKSMAKKMKRGIQPDITRLAKCQFMYRLTRAAAKEIERMEECRVHFTPAERLALHVAIASDIIDEATHNIA